MQRQKQWVAAVLLVVSRCSAEFVYYDFNGTTGLVLNGNAATSSCIPFPATSYSTLAGADDTREATLDIVQEQFGELFSIETAMTEDPATSASIAGRSAMAGHRDAFVASQTTQCAVRLRLTASQPRQVSSVWYSEPLPVLQGFETRFTFQITDQSRHCFEVRDQNFGTRQYESCMVHGGDGFAFVVHGHPNKTSTIGFGGSGALKRSLMGFEGVENSLAIEFDTWFNSEEGADTFYDHVTVYSMGTGSNSVTERSRLSASTIQDLADGRIHAVKIRYYNELRLEYAPYFSATSNLVKFIKDVSEGRRVGTLAVFMDDGIETDTPILALPINLAATLRLPADEAFVGFTASTGKSWQKHDVLGWYYCTSPPCLDEAGTERTFEFDYNDQSMLSTASHGRDVYPVYIYPDSEPWARRQAYFASGQRIGLAS